ncbi:MAG TPA: hypothetical protein PKE58_01260 [Acidobacteriota bacterium]|nr:hypothetical protein [Acidobacteriota bacterium]
MNSWTQNPEVFIEQCIAALGGHDALRGVTSIKIHACRHTHSAENPEPLISNLFTYRAVGGRIRLEEHFSDHISVVVINGLAGECATFASQSDLEANRRQTTDPLHTCDVEPVKRSVRLYPRNFLAHANEHQYLPPETTVIDGRAVVWVDLPVEEVRFVFDSETLLCCAAEDFRTTITTRYEAYQLANGVMTPFLEQRFRQGALIQEDQIQLLEYNLPLDARLFDIAQ